MNYTLLFLILIVACSTPVHNYNEDTTLVVNTPTTVGDLTLTLAKLIYSPCPKGAVCVYAGIDIEIMVEKGEKKELLKFSAVPFEGEFRDYSIQLRSATKESIIVTVRPLNEG